MLVVDFALLDAHFRSPLAKRNSRGRVVSWSSVNGQQRHYSRGRRRRNGRWAQEEAPRAGSSPVVSPLSGVTWCAQPCNIYANNPINLGIGCCCCCSSFGVLDTDVVLPTAAPLASRKRRSRPATATAAARRPTGRPVRPLRRGSDPDQPRVVSQYALIRLRRGGGQCATVFSSRRRIPLERR